MKILAIGDFQGVFPAKLERRLQKEEFDLIVDSIELSNDPEVMESLKRSEEQIKNRDFSDWNELQNSSN